MPIEVLQRQHPRIYKEAHDYAWEKTCNLYNRHDGRLGGFQLEVHSAIRDAYIAAKGINVI